MFSRKNKWSRKSFLDMLLNTSGVAFLITLLYPVFKFLIPPEAEGADPTSVKVGSPNEVPPNSGKIFRFGRKPAILIRTKEGDFRAFTAICTHLDCTVQYRPDFQHIWCACHNGHYDLQGNNISGPPPRPLQRFIVNVNKDEIIVSKDI